MRPSAHQQRVLGALLALEQAHDWHWWTRDAIGHVVNAGGYHGVIQIKTIAVLKEAGLVMTERKSWPPEVAALVRCQCACHRWGLTKSGRDFAHQLQIRWPEASIKRVKDCTCDHSTLWRDEDEPPPGWDRRDDDDGGGDDPAPVVPPAEPVFV